MKVAIIPIVIGAFGTVTKGLLREWGPGGWRTGGDHPDYSIVENDQNTEKSSGDLRKLAFTETLVKNYLLTLM